MGAQLGLPQEGHHRGNPTQRGRHHQSPGELSGLGVSAEGKPETWIIVIHRKQAGPVK